MLRRFLNRLLGRTAPLEFLDMGDSCQTQISRAAAQGFTMCRILGGTDAYRPCVQFFFSTLDGQNLCYYPGSMEAAEDCIERIKHAITSWGAGLPVAIEIKADWSTAFAKPVTSIAA